MNEYTIFWLNGKSELIFGLTIDDAIQTIQKKGRVLYFTEGNSINNYEYNPEQKSWSPKKGIKFNLEFHPLVVTNEGKDDEGDTIRSFFIDDSGENKLMIKQNNKLITISLKLGQMKKRHIGVVTKSTRTIEMKRKRERHLLREKQAYGFNFYVLKNQTSIDWVRLLDDTGCSWKVPVKYILDQGDFLFFKDKGFEIQRFLTLNQLEQFRVHNYENRRL